MLFSIKITSSDGEIIEIGKADTPAEKNLITNIDIHMDTVNNNVSNKSNAMLAKITIFGSIDEAINSEILKLFEWSKESHKEKWYRTLEIKIKTDESTPYRTYSFENVFVVDYIEHYKVESAQGDESATNADKDHFELYLTQKENNFESIEAY